MYMPSFVAVSVVVFKLLPVKVWQSTYLSSSTRGVTSKQKNKNNSYVLSDVGRENSHNWVSEEAAYIVSEHRRLLTIAEGNVPRC